MPRCPEGAIVADEANTSGLFIPGITAGAPRHDWMTLHGRGDRLRNAGGDRRRRRGAGSTGALLEADGSAMYTFQALWTQAREGLNVTTVIFNNRSYAILNLELSRTGAGEPGPKALDMLDLHRPDIDFVRLSRGSGCPAPARRTSAEGLTRSARAFPVRGGPVVVEVELAFDRRSERRDRQTGSRSQSWRSILESACGSRRCS